MKTSVDSVPRRAARLAVGGSGSGRGRRRAWHRWIAAFGLCVALAPQAHADDDHELARAAVRAGEALPLRDLLDRLQRTHPGQVLELELEREDDRWIYEVKLLQDDGQLLKLEVDARTAQVLRVKRKADRRRHDGDTRR